MDLFERIKADWSPEQYAEYERTLADIREHEKQRACPERCGCTEFYDDRTNEVTGGFGVAGCACDRCNGGE